MLPDNIPLFLLALILGIKHAYDPDHVVAVSTYIVKSSSLAQTLKMSVSWAVGHMATAGIITFLIFLYKDFFLSSVLGYFESVVGVMLILLGMASIISYRGIELFHDHSHPAKDSGHLHAHTHEEGEVHTHFHKHMFGIGIVHGLASNDELIVLFTASLGVATLFGLISYVAIYSLGVILGMVGFGYAISFPILKNRKERLTKSAMLFFGIVSIIYGGLIIFTGPLA